MERDKERKSVRVKERTVRNQRVREIGREEGRKTVERGEAKRSIKWVGVDNLHLFCQ